MESEEDTHGYFLILAASLKSFYRRNQEKSTTYNEFASLILFPELQVYCCIIKNGMHWLCDHSEYY